MTEFERVLGECLLDLEEGASSLDECLMRYPEHASELQPILLASTYLKRSGEAHLSDDFKQRVRTRLLKEMYLHPHRRVGRASPFPRLAVGLASILLALLAVGTAYAQNALPGEAFYAWKLASEHAWRLVASDPVGADLAIAARRAGELIAVREQPALYSQTLEAYLEAVACLRSETDAQSAARIEVALAAQAEELSQAGLNLPIPTEIPDVLPSEEQQEPAPTATPLPVLQTPGKLPTNLPQVTPTVAIPPVSIATVESPLQIVPTVEISPPLP
jgi:hypothetical protein